MEPRRTTVLGLDIGGANLKAATNAGRAISVPFPLWKQPDELPAALAALVAEFPDIDEFAVTMTGELCDCYATKREGVNRILDAVQFAAASRIGNLPGSAGGTPVLGSTGVPPVGSHLSEVDSNSQANRRDAGPTQDRRDAGITQDRRDAGITQDRRGAEQDRRDAGVTQDRRVAGRLPIRDETITRRKLPHIQKPQHTYHVIFRTAISQLPSAARQIAFDACLFWNGKKATVHACVVMPGHVHLLLTPAELEDGSCVNLTEIMQSIKSYSAHRINSLLKRQGACWQRESYDRFMRSDDDFREKLEYIRNNPASAGLVDYWHDYPFLFIDNETNHTGVPPVAGRAGVPPVLGSTGVPPVLGSTGVPPVGSNLSEVNSISQANRRDAGPTQDRRNAEQDRRDAEQDRRDAGPTQDRSTAHVLRVRVWSTAGEWLSIREARVQPLAVAASNWHALATFAGRFAPEGNGLLIDIGSTTTDIIPLSNGWPQTLGLTDADRLQTGELVYLGVKRTPIMALGLPNVCSEYFADMRDVHIVLGQAPEEPDSTDTADGRPATMEFCLDRLARMFGADRETASVDRIVDFAIRCYQQQREKIVSGIHRVDVSDVRTLVVSGAGEWLARQAWTAAYPELKPQSVSLAAELGPEISACAPAYAVAVLAAEMPV